MGVANNAMLASQTLTEAVRKSPGAHREALLPKSPPAYLSRTRESAALTQRYRTRLRTNIDKYTRNRYNAERR